jgi:hypothetical protein
VAQSRQNFRASGSCAVAVAVLYYPASPLCLGGEWKTGAAASLLAAKGVFRCGDIKSDGVRFFVTLVLISSLPVDHLDYLPKILFLTVKVGLDVMNIAQNKKNRIVSITITIILVLSLVSGLLTGSVAAQDTSNLNIGSVDAPVEVSVNEAVEIESNAEIPSLPADWSAELEFTLLEAKDGGANQLGTQEISVEDGESVNVAIEHEFDESGVKEVYFDVEGEITREGAVSSQTADIERTTQSVTIDVPGELDPDKIDISDIDVPSEVSPTEPIEIESSANIPDLPADWSADLDFVLYVNDQQAGTQQINIEDGESVDVAIEHEFQGIGNKQVYYEVTGDVTREGPVATQTAEIDRTTQTVTVGVLDELNVDEIGVEDFTTPSEITLDEQIEPQATVVIPDLPAEWSAELDSALYVDGDQVTTRQITVEDGEEVDVTAEHEFEEAGTKEVYYEISGEVVRETDVATQSANIDRTTRTATVTVEEPESESSEETESSEDSTDVDSSDDAEESDESESSDDESTTDQNNGDDGGSVTVETPGFGIISVIAAFGGSYLLIGRKVNRGSE